MSTLKFTDVNYCPLYIRDDYTRANEFMSHLSLRTLRTLLSSEISIFGCLLNFKRTVKEDLVMFIK